jgi:hypothetical protein
MQIGLENAMNDHAPIPGKASKLHHATLSETQQTTMLNDASLRNAKSEQVLAGYVTTENDKGGIECKAAFGDPLKGTMEFLKGGVAEATTKIAIPCSKLPPPKP